MTAAASPPVWRRLRRLAVWLVPCAVYLWAVLPAPHATGRDLVPFPDAEEYALLATRLAQLQSPLIPVGLQLYPSRYSMAYPLLSAPLAWIGGFDLSRMWWASALFGLLAVLMMTRVGGWLLGSRAAGGLAAVFFALHPETVRAATSNMSETAIVMMFFVALELARPWLDPRRAGSSIAPAVRAALLGLALGWLTLAKAPFVYWAVALAALAFLDACQSRRPASVLTLVAAGLALALADLLYRHWAFGDWSTNGYAYWFPPVYADFTSIFNPRYLTHPWLAFNVGNAVHYGRMAFGIDNYFYNRPMAAVIVGGGVAALWPARRGCPTRAVFWLMAVWAALGAAFCGLYFWQSARFPLLWAPVADLLAAWALLRVPYWRPFRRRRLVRWAQLAALLAMLAILRGELLSVNGLFHLPDDPRRAPGLADQIRPLLADVPDGAWVLTNYQPPLVEAWRPHPGPTAALYDYDLDYYLMNPHIYGAWQFRLPPRALRPDADRWIDPIPAPWTTGPTVLIDPNRQWVLSDADLRRLFDRPVYFLLVHHPDLPVSGQYLVDTIMPMLRARLRLQAGASAADVTLYQADWPARSGGRP